MGQMLFRWRGISAPSKLPDPGTSSMSVLDDLFLVDTTHGPVSSLDLGSGFAGGLPKTENIRKWSTRQKSLETYDLNTYLGLL